MVKVKKVHIAVTYFDIFSVRIVEISSAKVAKQYLRVLSGVLAPSSHCGILIETLLTGKAGLENDLSMAPVATMDLTNSTNCDNEIDSQGSGKTSELSGIITNVCA